MQALDQHDQQYQRHPSTERDRQVIVNDLEALRQSLAQSEQEPVAWMDEDGYVWAVDSVNVEYKLQKMTPLYTAPPKREWVWLTDEEVDECYYWKDRLWTTDELVRHVEAKLKEKNT